MNPNADNPVQVDGTHGDAVTSGKQPETQSDSLGANPAPKVVNASTEAGIEMTVIRSNLSVRDSLYC